MLLKEVNASSKFTDLLKLKGGRGREGAENSNLPKEVGNTEASARNRFLSSQVSQSGPTTP